MSDKIIAIANWKGGAGNPGQAVSARTHTISRIRAAKELSSGGTFALSLVDRLLTPVGRLGKPKAASGPSTASGGAARFDALDNVAEQVENLPGETVASDGEKIEDDRLLKAPCSSRSSRRDTLPAPVFGSSPRNSMRCGTL